MRIGPVLRCQQHGRCAIGQRRRAEAAAVHQPERVVPVDVDIAARLNRQVESTVAGKLIEMAKVETKVIELTGRQGEGSVLPNPERPALPGSH